MSLTKVNVTWGVGLVGWGSRVRGQRDNAQIKIKESFWTYRDLTIFEEIPGYFQVFQVIFSENPRLFYRSEELTGFQQ